MAVRKSRYSRSVLLAFALLLIPGSFRAGAVSAQTSAPATPSTPSSGQSNADFLAATDEVLKDMSQITGLELKTPIKRTLRSRDEIRAYVLRQMNEDRTPEERYADEKSAEAFGLIPKNFDLDSFMVELLTEQIAGLYDPKAHEFYIADWIPLDDQKMVMAHELTHALQDQHFQIENWLKAAKPNADAELAREAVLEGSAMAAMVDYMLEGTGHSMKELPAFDPSLLVGDMQNSPTLQKAPTFIKDGLIFPYFGGMMFTAAVLKTPGGWNAVSGVFARPPLSTQQIIHPELYFANKRPEAVELPKAAKGPGAEWKKLDENDLGEFGWKEVLKQFLGEERAKALSAAWVGDRYIVFENNKDKRLLLITELRLANIEETNRFFGQYSEALEKKHSERENLLRRPNFFSFDTPEGPVFLRCVNTECLTLEGGPRSLFVQMNSELGWAAVPEAPQTPEAHPVHTARSSRTGAVAKAQARGGF
jgi:hypothetical protein